MQNILKKTIFYLGIFFILFFFLICISYLLIDKNYFQLKSNLYKNYPNLNIRKEIFKKKSIIENINNDYNIKFLPYTEFEKVSFKKKKIIFSKEYYKPQVDESISYKRYGTFFIDFFKNDLILTDYKGNVYLIKDFDNSLRNNESPITPIVLRKNINFNRVYDAFILEEKIYISHSEIKNGCKTPKISYAKLSTTELDFKNFFKSSECNPNGSPGKLQYFKLQGTEGLLMSTSEGKNDLIGNNIQNPNSIYGKILFIPFNGQSAIILSKGHRVIQGLFADGQTIISTEHGPRGGDEINKIVEGGNYGWPIASYGERYDFNYDNNKITYKKNHKKNNFIDPIFSFIEGIGISEIIKIPKTYSIYYPDHYAVSSLNGRSLYFLRLNDEKDKVITLEKVFLNFRIRDLKFYQKKNYFLLALEEDGHIGILEKIKK